MVTGQTVAKGDVLTFTATGTYGDVSNPSYTPKSVGCKAVASGGAIAPKLTAWAIVGQIGDTASGTVLFCIGASAKVTASKAGPLWVAINERLTHAGMADYIGFVTVQWSISHQP